jgi:hypothetical protein
MSVNRISTRVRELRRPDSREAREVLEFCLDRFMEIYHAMSGGPMEYYVEKQRDYQNALFDRFAPFKVNDRVRLPHDIECKGGWRGLEPTLQKGALGTVTTVDYRNGQFVIDVVFDVELTTAHDGNGEEITVTVPPERRHTFALLEHELEKVE